jgi:hypothetical protein
MVSDSEQEFYVQDMSWYSSLDNTKWLSMVAKCLKASHDIVTIVTNKRSVVIQGKNEILLLLYK